MRREDQKFEIRGFRGSLRPARAAWILGSKADKQVIKVTGKPGRPVVPTSSKTAKTKTGTLLKDVQNPSVEML